MTPPPDPPAERPTELRPSRVLRATGLLADFNAAGILAAADIHVASTIGRLADETDETVLLAAALTVRGTRAGSVVLKLADAAKVIVPEAVEASGYNSFADDPDSPRVDPAGLRWPEPERWIAACAKSPLTGGPDEPGRPLRLVDGKMWLDRYWTQEVQVADALIGRVAADPPAVDEDRLSAALDRLFPPGDDADQRRAAEAAVRSRLAVVAGGPGTGKTTTVARLLAVLADQPGGPPRVALAAPTGKAAARLTEAVRLAAGRIESAQDRARVGEPEATTIHRLLGFKPGSKSRFRHDRTNRLPHDIVVIDETSMVSLTQMARIVEALRPATRLVLVGDPDQLASVEAGAVLGDIVDPGQGQSRLGDVVVTLRHTWRFGEASAIAVLAAAVRDDHPNEVLDLLRAGTGGIEFVEVDDDAVVPESVLGPLKREVEIAGEAMRAAAEAGDAHAALEAMERHRLLCAHRVGPRGVRHWTERIHGWLGGHAPGRSDGRYVGEPVLVTTNDPNIDLYNGDTGVVIATAGADPVAVFRRGSEVRRVALGRLPDARTVHTMTVHKSQGSEFDRVSLILPPAASPLATRQMLYTALTRAKSGIRVIGSAAAVERAVGRPAARASGLGDRLRTP